MERISLQNVGKERTALVVMAVIAILCLGFGVIANISKQREAGKRAEIEAKLDKLAQENGKLQKDLGQARARLDEEAQLNQTLNESLADEQKSAAALRSELDRVNQARRELEKQIQQLQSSNKDLETRLQAKAIGVMSQPQAIATNK